MRKADSKKMEYIGNVMSLSKQVISGYKTMNSVVVDADNQSVNLLCHELYSNKMPSYIGETVLKDAKLVAQLSAEKQEHIVKKSYINTKVLYYKNLKTSSEFLKKERPGVQVCHLSDREFDGEDDFNYITEVLKDDFVSRLKNSRRSHETRITYTPTGKVSSCIAYQKLTDKVFKNSSTYSIEKIAFHGKTYQDVTAIIEWEILQLNTKKYNVVRITLKKGGIALFLQPMLLITNRNISNHTQAKEVYMAYLLRSKIEVVFKFLKQYLGWESFQIRDFNSIKNLLAFAFFLVGYFPELEDELKKHPLSLNLCHLALSKGKVTIHFLLKGIEKLVHFQEVEQWISDNQISKEQLDEILSNFRTRNNSSVT
jgi:hypothetical protein